jgi:hypothetical protein
MLKRRIKYFVVFLLGSFFQEKFIFKEGKLPLNFTFFFNTAFKEVNLTTVDNETINALFFQLKNPKGVILYFHGNQGDLSRWGKITEWFIQFSYDVFVIDYRNYGKSSGCFNEQEMLKDALLAYDYLKKTYNEDQIIVYGRSLGTTFATKVASENNPKELILEVPFYNLMSAIKYHLKFPPNFLIKYKFNTNEFMIKVTCPVTIFHGTEDVVTNPEDSQRLFDLVQNPRKKFIKIKGGRHGNLRDFDAYKMNLKLILER